jgi:hypothetical protein
MNLKRLLHVLHENIDEAAVSISQAQEQGLALLIQSPSPGTVRAILYDKNFVEQNINAIKKTKSKKYLLPAIHAFIIVQPTTGSCAKNNLSEVTAVAAKKGYGPLIYDIILSFIHPNYLTSDRSNVEPAAFNIWYTYFHSRNDVSKSPLPNSCKLPKDYQDLNPPNPLAFKYKINTPLNLQPLIDHHDLIQSYFNNNLNIILANSGIAFFNKYYRAK